MSRSARLLLPTVVLALLLTVACTPRGLKDLYVPLGVGAGYGYTEQAVANRRFQVTYDAPIDTAFAFGSREKDRELARAFDLALLRAADVAGANGAPSFRIVERVNDVDVRSYPTYRDPFWHTGWRRPFHPYPWAYGPYYDDSYATLATRVTLTIELLQRPEPGAYDVNNVQATIRARYAMPES